MFTYWGQNRDFTARRYRSQKSSCQASTASRIPCISSASPFDAVTAAPAPTPHKKRFPAFFCRSQVWIPTWRGWLLFLLMGGLLAPFVLPGLYRFLAVNAPLSGVEVLVMEGWASDE